MLTLPMVKNKRPDKTIDKEYVVILKRMRRVTPTLSQIPHINILSCLVLPLSNVNIDCGLKSKVLPICLLENVDEKLINVLGKLNPMMLINMYTYKVFELLFNSNTVENSENDKYKPSEIIKEVFDITKSSLNLKDPIDNLNYLDAGITKWNVRPRKLSNNQKLQTINVVPRILTE